MRILLAEDEHALGEWLSKALEQSGFRVDWRDDGVWLTGPVARVFDGVLSPDFVAAHP